MEKFVKEKVIVGLGETGWSCAQFFRNKQVPFRIADSRTKPPYLEKLKVEMPEVTVSLGEFVENDFLEADELIVSPGIDLRLPVFEMARQKGIKIRGDVDVFAEYNSKPVIAITGSNAKSTVTTLVGEMAKNSGINTGVGGNIGLPVLELLAEDRFSLIVLELSSFQLESTENLGASVATVLNVSPDHMDRYESFDEYVKAKLRIFNGCQKVVINQDATNFLADTEIAAERIYFGMNCEGVNLFCVTEKEGGQFIAMDGQPLFSVSELKISGSHNVSNVLAALTLGFAAGLPLEKMIEAAKVFPGLPHRCQWVRELNGINFYNDSKGTNVGAATAAIRGLAEKGNIILLAGGESKGAEFKELGKVMSEFGKLLVLYGADAMTIKDHVNNEIAGKVKILFADSLKEALQKAYVNAEKGDLILLSPACASFDQFRNFEERGCVFVDAVQELH